MDIRMACILSETSCTSCDVCAASAYGCVPDGPACENSP